MPIKYLSQIFAPNINTNGTNGINGGSEVRQKQFMTQPASDGFLGVKNDHRPTFGQTDRTTTNGDPRLKNDLHTFMTWA